MNDHSVTSTITIRKSRLSPEQRMAAKALLLDVDRNAILTGGQLILHYGPGRNPIFVEIQERSDNVQQTQLKLSA